MPLVVYAAPKSPSKQNLNNLDASYLKYYLDILLPHFIEERNRPDKRHASELIVNRFFGAGSLSNSVRAAVILYAYTFRQFENPDVSQILEYRQQFFTLMRSAFVRKSVTEVVYASHLFCLHGFLSGLPFSEIAPHADGFLSGVKELLWDGDLEPEELFLLRCMCKDLFCWMTSGIGGEKEEVELDEERPIRLFQLSQMTHSIFESGMQYGHEPEWMKSSESYLRMQMLLYRLNIALDFYKLKRSSSLETDDKQWFTDFTFDLTSILSDLVSTIQDNPEIRSMTDRNGLFGADSFQALSAAYPHDPNDPEWLLWQPSLLAHYKSSFKDLWDTDRKKPPDEEVSHAAVEEGFSTCRLIESAEKKSGKITCLSALRSLIITFWLEVSAENDPGASSPTEMRANQQTQKRFVRSSDGTSIWGNIFP